MSTSDRRSSALALRLAHGLGIPVILGLAVVLALFGSAGIGLSTDSCPSELSSECSSRVEVAVGTNLVLQVGAVGAGVWVSCSKRLRTAQRFLGLGGLALAQVLATSAAASWVTSLW